MNSSSTHLTFPGAQGAPLAAILELPAQTPAAYAVFAHCFTRGKDSHAAARISKALTAHGIAVLRFDFTGLGRPGGNFAQSTFTSDVEDLVRLAGRPFRIRQDFIDDLLAQPPKPCGSAPCMRHCWSCVPRRTEPSASTTHGRRSWPASAPTPWTPMEVGTGGRATRYVGEWDLPLRPMVYRVFGPLSDLYMRRRGR
ncbi:alpha/beta hydrolase family protein [Streptomyces flavofungini]|uniref:alpha/beta hydrolase family protein n=1 Tax=Streptomyces flavofungini TaxID=68200 RepID=UPI0025B0B39F|nr:hypothetical protein [Streptomyces flavofungini]WJV51626.1 hypothetical protein QUY26_04020 [Streptomyces flavofungini]